MADHSTTRRTLLAGTLSGSALGGLTLLDGDAQAAVTVPSAPAVDFFLQVPGIPGESTDAQFPGSIVVLDWSAGAVTSISPTNTGGGTGKVKPRPLTFVSRVSKASPILFKSCATGKHFASATIVCRRRADKQPFLEVRIENVYVSSYQQAPHSVDGLPLDVVGLDYGVATMTFRAQNADGSLATPVVVRVDYLKNVVR